MYSILCMSAGCVSPLSCICVCVCVSVCGQFHRASLRQCLTTAVWTKANKSSRNYRPSSRASRGRVVHLASLNDTKEDGVMDDEANYFKRNSIFSYISPTPFFSISLPFTMFNTYFIKRKRLSFTAQKSKTNWCPSCHAQTWSIFSGP